MGGGPRARSASLLDGEDVSPPTRRRADMAAETCLDEQSLEMDLERLLDAAMDGYSGDTALDASSKGINDFGDGTAAPTALDLDSRGLDLEGELEAMLEEGEQTNSQKATAMQSTQQNADPAFGSWDFEDSLEQDSGVPLTQPGTQAANASQPRFVENELETMLEAGFEEAPINSGVACASAAATMLDPRGSASQSFGATAAEDDEETLERDLESLMEAAEQNEEPGNERPALERRQARSDLLGTQDDDDDAQKFWEGMDAAKDTQEPACGTQQTDGGELEADLEKLMDEDALFSSTAF